MPYPQQVHSQEGFLPINRSFSVCLSGYSSPRLQRAVRRVAERLQRQTGIFIGNPSGPCDHGPSESTLLVDVTQEDGTHPQQFNEDESYQLNVTPRQAILGANTTFGALRGMETFLQMVADTQDGTHIPANSIYDFPRFPWRGALVDCSRHFLPIDAIKRQVAAIASAKFNVFHWHLTDDQGWRMESETYPLLQARASDGDYYTKTQILDVVQFAADRGVRVIPEIDLPGHSSAVGVAYPDLMTVKKSYGMNGTFGVLRPLLDPTQQTTADFIRKIFTEVTQLFPDQFVHIGGDEVDPTQWIESAHVRKYMLARNISNGDELHTYFNLHTLLPILTSLNRTMVGWDEILSDTLPRDTIIQSWRGKDSISVAAKQGFRTLLACGEMRHTHTSGPLIAHIV
jgi:hexosaminidase